MFVGGIYYKLFNFFSIIFQKMYISSCITCLNVYKLENNVCNVSYIVLSFMFIIIRCCLILCYICMFMGGFYYKLFNLFFINMHVSSCMTCWYVYKLENKL